RAPSRDRGRRQRRPDAEGVRAPPRLHGSGGAGARARASAEPRVGLCPRGRDRVEDGRRPRTAAAREARQRRTADHHGEERGLPLRERRRRYLVIGFLRRRIAIKLTLTLVGFVAVSVLAAGFYLGDALERAAVESLEGRLATAGRLLHDEALTR